MPLKLKVETPNESIKRYEFILDEPEISLGRSASCSSQLPYPTISSEHDNIVREGDGYMLADLGSTNGTRLNERLLKPNHYAPLSHGDRIVLTDVVIHVIMLGQDQGDVMDSVRTGELVRQMVFDMVRHSGELDDTSAYMEVLQGPDRGVKKMLNTAGQELGLGYEGRARHWDLTDTECAAVGAWLRGNEDGFWLHQDPSGNGPILLNGIPAPGTPPWHLRSGARIRIGNTTMLFFDPLQDYLDKLEEPPGAGPLSVDNPLSLSQTPHDSLQAPDSLSMAVFPRTNTQRVRSRQEVPEAPVYTAAGLPLSVGPEPALIEANKEENQARKDAPALQNWSTLEKLALIAIVGFSIIAALGFLFYFSP